MGRRRWGASITTKQRNLKVVEEQVDEVLAVADGEADLATDEGEAGAQLERAPLTGRALAQARWAVCKSARRRR
jgi:hypothetical protein